MSVRAHCASAGSPAAMARIASSDKPTWKPSSCTPASAWTPASVGASACCTGTAPPIAATISSACAFAAAASRVTAANSIISRFKTSKRFLRPGAASSASPTPAPPGAVSSALYASRQYLVLDAADANIATDRILAIESLVSTGTGERSMPSKTSSSPNRSHAPSSQLPALSPTSASRASSRSARQHPVTAALAAGGGAGSVAEPSPVGSHGRDVTSHCATP